MLAFIATCAAVSIGAYRRNGAVADRPKGSALLGADLRGWYFATLRPFEDFCVASRVPPTALSLAQLLASLVAALCLARGLIFTGGWLLLFTGSFDIIDGRVARRTGTGSRRGAFLDSVVDRCADSFGLLGLAYFFRDSWVSQAVLLGLVGSLMVSYTRARAEGLGVDCTVGFLQRPERYVILGLGIVAGSLCEHILGPLPLGGHYAVVAWVVSFLGISAWLTVWQRSVHVWHALGPERSGRSGEDV